MQPHTAQPSHSKPADRLIGIGQMGGHVASMILERERMAIRGLALDIDDALFEGWHPALRTLLCDAEGNMRFYKEMDAPADKQHQDPSELGGRSEWVVLVTGLGGEFSAQAIPQIVSKVKEQGSMVVVVASLPFDMEGEEKKASAEASLKHLLQTADAVIALPNQSYLKNHTKPVKLKQAFELSRLALAQAVEGVWEMLHADGLTNIRVSHLKEIFQGHHVEGLFASAEAEGSNRAKLAVEALLKHPQMEGGNALRLADACLLQVTGDESLTFKEVDRVKRHIRRFLPTDKSMVVGTSVFGKQEGSLAIRLISAHFAGSKPAHVMVEVEDAKPVEDTFPVKIENPKQETPPSPSEEVPFEDPLFSHANQDSVDEPTHPMAPPPSSKGSKRSNKRYFQTFLNLGGKKQGRFADCDPTFYNSVNLDEPTFQRKNVLFN